MAAATQAVPVPEPVRFENREELKALVGQKNATLRMQVCVSHFLYFSVVHRSRLVFYCGICCISAD